VANQSKAELTLKVQSPDTFNDFHFHPHQERAISAMTKFYAREKRGVLVIPTGGGKTETATRWTLRRHVALGGRVLWLAHRRSLLLQAFSTYHRAARDAGGDLENPRETLTLIRISGEDLSWSNVESRHDIVFATLHSTSPQRSLGFVQQMAEQTKLPLFVVIDEAHHVAANGYQRILKALEPYNFHLLGLTATPVRMDERDERRLWNSLGKVIYQVDKRELIEKEILSIPITVTVETKIDFEKDFSSEEVKHMDQWGDLGQRTLESISKHAPRNALIVDHYQEQLAKYGKTMVFAANVAHAVTLQREFSQRGISSDYVANGKADSNQVMEAFRTGGGPEVLVSVDMLTEGYDAPCTKTVFLTRPTQSESLFSQMIGRALRGPAAGGTREAFLVTFVDSWTRFQVLDPEYIVGPGFVDDAEPTKPRPNYELVSIETEMILEAYRLVQSNILSASVSVHDCLPGAWYSWEEEFQDDLQTRRVLIFDHQLPFFEEIRTGNHRLPEEVLAQYDYLKNLYSQVFADCPDPRPRLSDVRNLLEARHKELQIHYYTFEQKEEFSSVRVARQIYEEDVVPRKQRERIQQVFDSSAVCQAVYRGDFNRFHEDVKRELQEIDHVRSHGVLPEEVEYVPERPAESWPQGHSGYDLYQIMRRQMTAFPQGLDIQDIRYSQRPISGYWGQYRQNDRVIIVNPLLNSPDIPIFVVEFLVYHELLHADMPDQGHSQEFRERERNFRPSSLAIEDAAQRGFHEGKIVDHWRIMSDQFLDTYHKRYLLASGQGKMLK
jgi:superfamily II DNA or RNA helicase